MTAIRFSAMQLFYNQQKGNFNIVQNPAGKVVIVSDQEQNPKKQLSVLDGREQFEVVARPLNIKGQSYYPVRMTPKGELFIDRFSTIGAQG